MAGLVQYANLLSIICFIQHVKIIEMEKSLEELGELLTKCGETITSMVESLEEGMKEISTNESHMYKFN